MDAIERRACRNATHPPDIRVMASSPMRKLRKTAGVVVVPVSSAKVRDGESRGEI